MVDFSLWDILRNLLMAARWTVTLSLIAFIGGGIVGLLLLVLRLSGVRGSGRAVGAYVQLFQGTPLLMQLFLAYFGIALFGIKTSPWTAAAVALTLYTSAYLTEIWRGCVASIPKGQWGPRKAWRSTLASSCAMWCCPRPCALRCRRRWGFWCR